MAELTSGLAWVAVIALAWTAIALPAAVVVGRFIHWSGNQDEEEPRCPQ